MNYHVNQTVHGFRVHKAEQSRDPEGNAVLMEHVRTGARLFWLDNGAENMVFSIAFRTLPEDSTGVFHILEQLVHQIFHFQHSLYHLCLLEQMHP